MTEVETMDALDLASGHPRTHLLFTACLFRRFIGIVTLPSEGELLWMHEELDRLTSEVDQKNIEITDTRTTLETERQQLQENVVKVRQETRQKALAREYQLYQRIEALETCMADEKAKHEHSEEALRHSYLEYRTFINSTVHRTIDLLHAYRERREELFEGANLYSITAFDNEGKRIVFSIPAPALNKSCHFDLVNFSSRASRTAKEKSRGPCTSSSAMEDSSTVEKTNNQRPYNGDELSTSSGSNFQSDDDETQVSVPAVVISCNDNIHSKTKWSDERRPSYFSETTPFATRRGKSYSAPPDVMMDPDTLDTFSVATTHASARPSAVIQSIHASTAYEMNETSFGAENDLHGLVYQLIEENMKQLQQIQLLAAKVDEMTWLNQVMGDKVRAFSEELIFNKATNACRESTVNQSSNSNTTKKKKFFNS
jgi:hypothetical protein